jgi:glycosyltransferase involved in cell wall biosynthesis
MSFGLGRQPAASVGAKRKPMSAKSLERICLVPRTSGVGGMVSFQHKLAGGLQQRGLEVVYDLADEPYQVVLVTGGTRDLPGLRRARRRGIPVIQRLDGMNWLHRLGGGFRTGLRHYLRAEYGNFMLQLIRTRLASRIVYQSRFVHGWWERVYGPTPVPSRVIYNGVDLNTYTCDGDEQPPTDRWRLLMVEGSLMGGYEQGLQVGVQLLERLATGYSAELGRLLELVVAGRVPEALQRRWETYLDQGAPGARLVWAGLVPSQEIPSLDRTAHLLYSADVNPACPNAVIEALACGLPVLAFDTGALAEIVTPGAGCIVPYGGDPWRLDPPDIQALAHGALEIIQSGPAGREAARLRAEAAFGLDSMVEAYLDFMGGG